MLSVSHTHCGPVVGRNLLSMYQFDDKQRQLVEAYTKDLHGKIVELVGAAQNNMTPVTGELGQRADDVCHQSPQQQGSGRARSCASWASSRGRSITRCRC